MKSLLSFLFLPSSCSFTVFPIDKGRHSALNSLPLCLALFGFFTIASPQIATASTKRDLSSLPAFYQKIFSASLEKAPDLQTKKKTVELKEASQWTSVTSWLPRLDLQISDNNSNANLYTGLVGSEYNYKQGALALSFPIYRRSVDLSIQSAQSDLEIARHEYSSALAEWDIKLRQIVGQLLISEYKKSALNKSLLVAEKTAQETKIRFENGSRSQIDVLKTQAQTTNLQSQLLSAKNESQKLWDQLQEYTGLSQSEIEKNDLVFTKIFNSRPEDENQLEETLAQLTGADLNSPSKTEALSLFEKNSRAKKSIDLQLEASQAKAKLLTAKEWPDLSFKYTLQRMGNQWSNITDAGSESRSYGFTLTIPIFNFGSTWSSDRESSASQSIARIQYDKSLASTRNQIEQGIDQIEVLKQLENSQSIRRKQNIELERLTLKSYEFGKSTSQELLTAQNESLQAKIDYAKARLDLCIAILQLNWNIGSNIE